MARPLQHATSNVISNMPIPRADRASAFAAANDFCETLKPLPPGVRLMKRLMSLSAAALLAVTFANAAHAAEAVTFMLDWLPAGDKAAVYLGVEKGLFEAE